MSIIAALYLAIGAYMYATLVLYSLAVGRKSTTCDFRFYRLAATMVIWPVIAIAWASVLIRWKREGRI